MTITIKLSDEQEASIRRQAAESGVNPEQFVLTLVDEAVLFEGFEPIPAGDPSDRAGAAAGVQQGLDDFAQGRHRPAAEVFREIKERYASG